MQLLFVCVIGLSNLKYIQSQLFLIDIVNFVRRLLNKREVELRYDFVV